MVHPTRNARANKSLSITIVVTLDQQCAFATIVFIRLMALIKLSLMW
jgi:hypothetical protein